MPCVPRQFAQAAGVVVADHLAHGRPDVPQEPLGQLGAADHAPRQDRQPRTQIVAAPRAELGGKRGGPVLAPGLPAIDVDVRQRPAGRRARAVEDLLQESAVVGLDAGLRRAGRIPGPRPPPDRAGSF